MEIIIAIVALVAAILNIILFFKLWGMTNNVSELRDLFVMEKNNGSREDLLNQLRVSYVLGENEKIKQKLILHFVERINNDCKAYDEYYLHHTGLNDSITTQVEHLSKALAIIGEETPERIKNMKTYRDFYEVFKRSDLIYWDRPLTEEQK